VFFDGAGRHRPRRKGEPSLTGRNANDDHGLSRVATAYQKALPVLNGSWQLAASTALGALLGWWLDNRFGTTPWLLLAGALLGVSAGMYAFIRAALAMNRGGPPTKREDR
jgi:F0F1-type ATP synthase assembly protein I